MSENLILLLFISRKIEQKRLIIKNKQNEKTKLIKLFVPLTNKFKEGQQIAIDYLFSILPKVNQNFQLIILKVICKIVENSSNSLQLIDHHLPFLISFLLKQNLSDDPSSSSSHLLVRCFILFFIYFLDFFFVSFIIYFNLFFVYLIKKI